MSKFVKIALPIVVIGAAAVVFVPYIIGYTVEKDVKKLQDKVPSNSGVTLKVDDYQRGWFSSTAHTILSFKQQSGLSKSITFSNTIYHGPVIFTKPSKESNRKFLLAKAYVISTISDPTQVPLTIDATIQFGQNILANAYANKISYPFGNDTGTSIVLQGVKAQQHSSDDYSKVKTKLDLGAIDLFDRANGSIKVKNIHHNSQFEAGPFDFWTGHGITTVSNFDLETKKNEHLIIQGLQIEQRSDQSDGRGEGSMRANIQSLNWNNNDYGSQTIEVSARNIDNQSLLALTQALENRQNKNLPVLPFGETFAKALAFFSQGIELSLDKLDVNTEFGRINANANFTVPKQSQGYGTIADLVQAINAFANIRLPQRLATNLLMGYLISASNSEEAAKAITPEQAESQLQAWVGDKLIEKQGDFYQIKVSLKAGQVYVNDKLFDPKMIQPIITQNTTKPEKPVASPTQATTP